MYVIKQCGGTCTAVKSIFRSPEMLSGEAYQAAVREQKKREVMRMSQGRKSIPLRAVLEAAFTGSVPDPDIVSL